MLVGCLVELPNLPESRGEVAGAVGNPGTHGLDREKARALDFGRGKDKGTVVDGGVDLDKFLPGIRAGTDFADRGELRADPEFLFGLAGRANVVIFARFEVSGRAGVPFGWLAVFPCAAFLQEKFARVVENENVHGAMQKISVVNLPARSRGHDTVGFVDNIECLAIMLRGRGSRRVERACEVDPLRYGKILSAAGG